MAVMRAAATRPPAEIQVVLMSGMLWVADGEGSHSHNYRFPFSSWVPRLLTRDFSANNICLVEVRLLY